MVCNLRSSLRPCVFTRETSILRVKLTRYVSVLPPDNPKAGAIGEVSTKTQYRGKHLASKLLEEAKGESQSGLTIHLPALMKRENYVLSTLHTGAAAPLYAKSGWISYPREVVIRSTETLPDNTQGYPIFAPK